ncbi:PF07603 family protein [Leptospira borgpetersenii serovar Pomona str. 200901868]|uniref:PF07603 family protein n=1 Tax=Leptospira borgpetersenii serovar Pomona str. 200901868 TaxID=1192866 RepID=M6WL73_LEPBO|nr:PF07603 family protein [Leptospira borgpetersenii serovar Pomona str. 200901868]
MNQTFGLLWMFASILFFASCSQAERISIDASSTTGLLFQGGIALGPNNQSQGNLESSEPKEISSFHFQASNHFFTTDFVGEISGTLITVQVPFGAIHRLKATFISTGANVEVNGLPQISGQTVNDFSSPVIYRVIAADKSVKDYTVQVIPVFRLTDAGQTNCYFTFCNDDPGQDADYSTGVPRAFQSNVVLSDYTAQPVTIDGQTGLTWKYCAVGQNNAVCSAHNYSYTQSDAITYCNNLNQINAGLGYAGIRDWRLPEIEELMTLSTHKTPSTAYIDLTEFPLGDGEFWSNTTNMSYTTEAWGFDFTYGSNNSANKSSRNMFVRCVSGGTIPIRNFSDFNNGTVKDNLTGLVWQKCSAGQIWSPTSPLCNAGNITSHNFVSALTTCKNLNLSGRTWRLPNVHELRSLLDFSSTTSTKINSTFFPNTPAVSQYATSNSIPASQIFRVNFTDAVINTANLSASNYVRCVSDGL